jgi:fatty-acyl-CoA synthase
LTGIFRWIERHADKTPDKPAILFEGRVVTYAQFAARVRAAAGALKKTYGVQPGGRVAYLGLGLPDAFYLLFACARIGAMFLPMNWRLAAPEHQFILGDSGAKLLIADADHRARAEGLRESLPGLTLAACDFEADGWAPFWDAVDGEDGEGGEEPAPVGGGDDPVLLVYTSGTTGRPKGAVLSQGALGVNALNAIHANDMSAADNALNVLPLFHVGGLNVLSTPAFYCGATLTLHRRFGPAGALAALQDGGVTLAVLVPAMIQAMMAEADWASAAFPDLRFVISGSTIVPLPLIEAMAAKGIPMGQVYGATETGPYATYLRAPDAGPKAGSAGRVAVHCQMRIVDADGQVVGAGQAGEILIKGDNLFSHYWRNETATREALKDGWHYTGDIGYLDDDGYLWVHDRKKDVIISGGENIYPAEVEMLLHAMEDVADGVVVGLADAKWGEVPVAVVQMNKYAEVDAAAFLARLDGKIANFKRPRDVVFTDSLPRNAMGKVLKHQVREEINE